MNSNTIFKKIITKISYFVKVQDFFTGVSHDHIFGVISSWGVLYVLNELDVHNVHYDLV